MYVQFSRMSKTVRQRKKVKNPSIKAQRKRQKKINNKSKFIKCALKQTVSRNAPESIIKQTWKADASITKNYEECGLKIKLNEDLKKKTALTQQNEESPEEAKPCVEGKILDTYNLML